MTIIKHALNTAFICKLFQDAARGRVECAYVSESRGFTVLGTVV